MADPVEVSMRLRIARAMHNARSDSYGGRPFDSMPIGYRQTSLRMVDAGLAEMMEPTIDMQVAGLEQWLCEAAQEDRSRANWRAMIQAARADQ